MKPDIMMFETSKTDVLIKQMIKNKSEVNKYIGALNEIISIFNVKLIIKLQVVSNMGHI